MGDESKNSVGDVDVILFFSSDVNGLPYSPQIVHKFKKTLTAEIKKLRMYEIAYKVSSPRNLSSR